MNIDISSTSYEVANKKEVIPVIIDYLNQFCLLNNISKEIAQQIMLATDEALTNIVLYSYNKENTGKININFKIINNEVIIELINFGKPFKPLNIFKKKRNDVNKLKIGGYGLVLMDSFMDIVEFTYNKKDLSNCLNMIKKLDQGEFIL